MSTEQKIQQESQVQSQSTQIEFKKVNTRLLGPMNIKIKAQEKTGLFPKNIDLMLPPVTFAVQAKFALILESKELEKAENIASSCEICYKNIDQDLEYFFFPESQGLRLCVKLNDEFYQKYSSLLKLSETKEFTLMTYIYALIDPAFDIAQ